MATTPKANAPTLIVFVTDAAGNGIPGASVSFAPEGETLSSLTIPGGQTGSAGRYVAKVPGAAPGEVFRATVSKSGYETGSIVTPVPTIGTYEATVTLFPTQLTGYAVGSYPSHVAVLDTPDLSVTTPLSGTFAYAVGSVTNTVTPDKIELEGVVDAAGSAVIGLDEALTIPLLPHLIADDVEADPYMSRQFTVIASIQEGNLTRAIGSRTTVAISTGVDPLDYINSGSQLARWLTPWPNSTIHHIPGIYNDALILLTAGSYKLVSTRFGGTGQPIADWPFTSDGIRLMRVRIPQPRPGDNRAELIIKTPANVAVSETLNVLYRAD